MPWPHIPPTFSRSHSESSDVYDTVRWNAGCSWPRLSCLLVGKELYRLRRRCSTVHMAGSVHKLYYSDYVMFSTGTMLQRHRDHATIHNRCLSTDTSVAHRSANTKTPAHRISMYPQTLSTKRHRPTQTVSRHKILGIVTCRALHKECNESTKGTVHAKLGTSINSHRRQCNSL